MYYLGAELLPQEGMAYEKRLTKKYFRYRIKIIRDTKYFR